MPGKNDNDFDCIIKMKEINTECEAMCQITAKVGKTKTDCSLCVYCLTYKFTLILSYNLQQNP
jgi:hypothetical protein